MEDTGIRGIYGRGFTNTTSFPLEFKVTHYDTKRDMLGDVRCLYKEYEGRSRVGVALAPDIIRGNTGGDYQETRKTADEVHIPLTAHVLESRGGGKYCREVGGGRAVPRLERLGFIRPDFIVVYCVCVEEGGFDIFK